MKNINLLKLEPRRREGGNGAAPREYLDFVVDGKPLSKRIGGDLASCLGWFVPEENARLFVGCCLNCPRIFRIIVAVFMFVLNVAIWDVVRFQR